MLTHSHREWHQTHSPSSAIKLIDSSFHYITIIRQTLWSKATCSECIQRWNATPKKCKNHFTLILAVGRNQTRMPLKAGVLACSVLGAACLYTPYMILRRQYASTWQSTHVHSVTHALLLCNSSSSGFPRLGARWWESTNRNKGYFSYATPQLNNSELFDSGNPLSHSFSFTFSPVSFRENSFFPSPRLACCTITHHCYEWKTELLALPLLMGSPS